MRQPYLLRLLFRFKKPDLLLTKPMELTTSPWEPLNLASPNLLLGSGYFPDPLQISKVFFRFFKSGDPERFENQWSISILFAFSKLCEKVAYNPRMLNFKFITLLWAVMSLTRRNHSALVALIQWVNNIASAVGNRRRQLSKFFKIFLSFSHYFRYLFSNRVLAIFKTL